MEDDVVAYLSHPAAVRGGGRRVTLVVAGKHHRRGRERRLGTTDLIDLFSRTGVCTVVSGTIIS